MPSSYSYEHEREQIFTEQGQRIFLKVRDRCENLLRSSGAFTLERAICGASAASFGGGHSWLHIACVERMVELGELVEVGRSGSWSQDRVFASPSHR